VFVESFWPVFAITFNDVENEDELFPPSDVDLLMHQQREHNRTREAVRQHRIANRPLYVTPTGAFEEEDAVNLSDYAAHSVIELDGLKDGQDVKKLLQPVDKVPIDPNVYETSAIFQDVQRVVGAQDATVQPGKTSATQSSIDESSKMTSLASNIDDVDDLLTNLAKKSGQVLLLNLEKEQVMEIVGPGAVWPELSGEQVMKEVWLECEAGSSGRPNKTQDLADFERVAPFMMQMPGIRPPWMTKHLIKILDSKIDLEEAMSEGLPSIQAINSLMGQPQQPGGAMAGTDGDPAQDPTQQAAAGENNMPQGGDTPGGPQAQFPIIKYNQQGQRVQA
jgi:hypothetical protein